jgi:prolyl-tRNA editing enzyme YbaK/EbsC (Cys-tRNA(Pro) deacylase)
MEKRGNRVSIEKVREYFSQWNMQDRVQELDHSSATVEEAAAALHTEGKRIAKTMSFMVDTQPILVVMAGDARVDNHKFKERFHKKASMIKTDVVEDVIGHPVGGVCPFAIKSNVKVFLDDSLKRFATVFPACGTGNSAIEMTLPELEKYSHSVEWIHVSKGWQI